MLSEKHYEIFSHQHLVSNILRRYPGARLEGIYPVGENAIIQIELFDGQHLSINDKVMSFEHIEEERLVEEERLANVFCVFVIQKNGRFLYHRHRKFMRNVPDAYIVAYKRMIKYMHPNMLEGKISFVEYT